jgi:hypothetical protein
MTKAKLTQIIRENPNLINDDNVFKIGPFSWGKESYGESLNVFVIASNYRVYLLFEFSNYPAQIKAINGLSVKELITYFDGNYRYEKLIEDHFAIHIARVITAHMRIYQTEKILIGSKEY